MLSSVSVTTAGQSSVSRLRLSPELSLDINVCRQYSTFVFSVGHLYAAEVSHDVVEKYKAEPHMGGGDEAVSPAALNY